MMLSSHTLKELIHDQFFLSEFDQELVLSWVSQPDALCRRNRAQVISIFPIIAGLIAQQADIPGHQEVTAVIDRGDPLLESMTKAFGISKPGLRALRQVKPAQLGPRWFHQPSVLFAALGTVSPNNLPKTPEDWEVLWRIWADSVRTVFRGKKSMLFRA